MSNFDNSEIACHNSGSESKHVDNIQSPRLRLGVHTAQYQHSITIITDVAATAACCCYTHKHTLLSRQRVCTDLCTAQFSLLNQSSQEAIAQLVGCLPNIHKELQRHINLMVAPAIPALARWSEEDPKFKGKSGLFFKASLSKESVSGMVALPLHNLPILPVHQPHFHSKGLESPLDNIKQYLHSGQ